MRPLQLTMTAFGPYRDTEMIDFTKLEDRRLFVISGNTGAGKTTIFDAICYALYGVASGEDRAEPRMLRSHFADDDTHTAVEFAFGVGRKTYLVYRQMAHRKGSNRSETGGKVELYETTSGQDVPLVDRFTIAEVNTKLESIIGLTREQFSQIVMLPQGEFRKLLTSDTENKEEILRRIFRTGLYQKLEERFYADSRELREQHRDAQSKVDIYVRQAQDTLPQREGSELTTILAQPHHNATQVAEGLAQECDFYRSRVQEAEQAKNKLQQQLQQEEARYHAALLLDGRFVQLTERRALLEQLNLQREEMEKKEARLTLAEKAARLEPYEEQILATTADLKTKKNQYEEKLQAIQTAEAAFQSATERYETEHAREGERKEAERLMQQLTELIPIVENLAARKEEVKQLAHQHEMLNKQLVEIDRKLQSLREGKIQYTEQIKSIEIQTSELSDKLQTREKMRSQAKLLRDVIELNKQIEDYSRIEIQQKREVERFKEEHDRLEQLWIEGQASMLATHLHDGKPCPVCGSEYHPEKATSSLSLPSRDQLQSAKDELRHIEQQWMAAQAQVAAARTNWDQYIGEMSEYGLSMDSAVEQYQQLVTAGKQLNGEIEQLEKQQGMLQKLRQGLEKFDQDLERLSQERDQLIAKQKNLAVDYSSKQSLLAKELEQIPESWQTPQLLSQQRAEQQKVVDQLAAKWLHAQHEFQKYQTQLAEERASGTQMARQLEELETNWEKTKEKFHLELAKSGFSSIKEYHEAKLPEPVRKNDRAELDTYQSTYRSLSQQVNDLERELTDQTRPDLELLRQGLTNCKEHLEQVRLTLQNADRYHQETERLYNALVSADLVSRELESRLEQVLDIYHMLKGDNALKISFERYILIEFLEQIIHAANIRLHELSNGQFVLQRSERLESRGRQSGLGFDVYDAYTGQNRDVKTLSGGEKFNASLCLALGMTDVIQAHQGGVSIEMMFIDEGFGSLDEDTLNKAIAALVDLQRAGRMIGVISHVEELKLAFPAVLEVNKTREGHSRTQMVLK